MTPIYDGRDAEATLALLRPQEMDSWFPVLPGCRARFWNAGHLLGSASIEVDLTGQVCADSIGCYQYSGVGGQMDFMRGAALSEGGKPIIALSSRTVKGIPRITPILKPGAGVVSTRAHVQYVITEYGIANLFGKNLQQRAQALTAIAHPDDREMLERAASERFGI